ncbi:hypothetical protein MAXJ12_33459 [Mesorhizobium alhagi CCNWXJ12-2]|uniref:Uncharacterized protein n=1 Tax=Mesorhizobium alhagi CCNWXJ12-2 TaxID=1107882 RepID=H0I2I8_9HYPH|nr:hypothetical protein MAXJ12_33459 [Mesorhizobium alhagi CCNWXJ12-2]
MPDASKGEASKCGFVWLLQPGGAPVKPNIASNMRNGDGFFEGDSQTHRRADIWEWRMG